VIVQLIAGNFLNEERIANAYARGKFNQKGWGKNKIKQGLKFKKVSDPLIKKALQSINGDDYLRMLHKVIEKKAAILSEKEPYKRRYKLHQYALSRGYEGDLIADVLKNSDL
jgi:regulatory protein